SWRVGKLWVDFAVRRHWMEPYSISAGTRLVRHIPTSVVLYSTPWKWRARSATRGAGGMVSMCVIRSSSIFQNLQNMILVVHAKLTSRQLTAGKTQQISMRISIIVSDKIWRNLQSAGTKRCRYPVWRVCHKYRPTNLNTANCEWRNNVLATNRF